MEGIRYRVRILGLKSPAGTIPLTALKHISGALLEGSERALRLSIEGTSVKRGRTPRWLSRALEFTVTGISEGSTVLEIEAPVLAESSPEQVQQRDLWYTLPNPEDTAVTLLGKSVRDASTKRLESEHYDRGVLESLLSYKYLLDNYLSAIEVDSQSRPREKFNIGRKELEAIRQVQAGTPEPRAIVIAGLFNLIEHAKRRFRVDLEDGIKIPGIADLPFITEEDMRALWGEKVTIKGIAHFTPSGKTRFIEAQIIRPFESGEEVFQNILELKSPQMFVEELTRTPRVRSPLSEVWGHWPGEESIEEILSALRQVSTENS